MRFTGFGLIQADGSWETLFYLNFDLVTAYLRKLVSFESGVLPPLLYKPPRTQYYPTVFSLSLEVSLAFLARRGRGGGKIKEMRQVRREGNAHRNAIQTVPMAG